MASQSACDDSRKNIRRDNHDSRPGVAGPKTADTASLETVEDRRLSDEISAVRRSCELDLEEFDYGIYFKARSYLESAKKQAILNLLHTHASSIERMAAKIMIYRRIQKEREKWSPNASRLRDKHNGAIRPRVELQQVAVTALKSVRPDILF